MFVQQEIVCVPWLLLDGKVVLFGTASIVDVGYH